MREIKFRAWDEEEKEWCNVSDLEERCKFWHGGSDDMGCLHAWDDSVVFCLFTGLKDRNGVEIYESDIVKHWHEEMFFEGEVTGWVTWEENSAAYYIEYPSCGQAMAVIDMDYALAEVIGNIHENPELLEDSHALKTWRRHNPPSPPPTAGAPKN